MNPHRAATDLENPEKSGNLKETSESQGICLKRSGNSRQNSRSQGKVREFCCLKFIFSQVKNPNFENFLGEHAPRPPYGLGLKVELNLGLEKSGKSRGFHIVWNVATLPQFLKSLWRSFLEVCPRCFGMFVTYCNPFWGGGGGGIAGNARYRPSISKLIW